MNFEDLGVGAGLEEHYKFFRFEMNFRYEWGMDQVTFLVFNIFYIFLSLRQLCPMLS